MTGTRNNDFLAELVSAAEANDVDQIRKSFRAWEDAGEASPPKERHNYPLIHFTPALNAALKLGNLEAAGEFFERGLPPAMDQFGSDSWVALNQGSTEANNWNIKNFDFLISRGWDVNYCWSHLGDILAQAACKSKIPLVKYLLSKGADPNLNAKADSHTPLEYAALWGDSETLSLLLGSSPVEEIRRSSALLNAAKVGDVKKIDILLDAGADINGIPDNWRLTESNLKDEKWGTALHVSAAHNQVACVAHLLEMGALKDIRNPAGLTPKEVAEKLGYQEAAELLK